VLVASNLPKVPDPLVIVKDPPRQLVPGKVEDGRPQCPVVPLWRAWPDPRPGLSFPKNSDGTASCSIW